MNSLDELGMQLKLHQSSLRNNYLNIYEHEIISRWAGKCKIVIISDDIPEHIASIFSMRFPKSEILILTYKKSFDSSKFSVLKNVNFHTFNSIKELLDWSCNIGLANVIIEHSANYKSHKINLFKSLFLHLKDNGVYFVEELHAKFISVLIDCDGDDINEYLDKLINLKISPQEIKKNQEKLTVSIAEHIEKVTIQGKLASIYKTGRTFKGLRPKMAKDLIDKKIISGEIIFESSTPDSYNGKNFSNGNNIELLRNRHKNPFKIPASYINRYSSTSCYPGQVVICDNFILPDTFRMQHHKNLSNRHLNSLGDFFYSLKSIVKTTDLKGDYLYLDSEYPSHFGHFTSEVVSRLWAWKHIKSKVPSLKVLISVDKQKQLPSFSRKILNSYGIEDVDIVTFDEPVKVENLFTASPYYVIGSHAHPNINETWLDIANGVKDGNPKIEGNKLFIARPNNGERKCVNPDRLEDIFINAGFEFFHPENHSWEDQIQTFSKAKYIAGYSGSGLFNIMFCRNATHVISIGSDSYNAVNEHLICSIKNINLDYIWADSLIKQGTSWSEKAFKSDYSFNYERDENYLLDVLSKLE